MQQKLHRVVHYVTGTPLAVGLGSLETNAPAADPGTYLGTLGRLQAAVVRGIRARAREGAGL